MKNVIDFLNGIDTKIDLSSNYELALTFEEYEELILEHINQQEIIYYYKAIDYLKENDNSLFESLSIAEAYGYDVENLNSELLATLLFQQNLHIEWSEIRGEIEEYFEEYSINALKIQCEEFFQYLIDKTGEYYLSDYVSTYGEFDSKIISYTHHQKIVEKLVVLKMLCKQYDIDLHAISCEVARKNFKF
jgi:hypothetical protein